MREMMNSLLATSRLVLDVILQLFLGFSMQQLCP